MASVAPPSPISAAGRPKLLVGKRVCLFCDFNFEDMELMYPKMRLEEEGATVLVVGAHEKGMKYTGKHGECARACLACLRARVSYVTAHTIILSCRLSHQERRERGDRRRFYV